MKKFIILAIYIILFWVILPGGLVLIALYCDSYFDFKSTSRQIAGILVLAFSIPMLSIAIVQFRKFSGKFPVSADPPKVFIRSGLYAVWRHPIYLFYTLTLLGGALVWGSKAMLIITLQGFIILEAVYIIIEEKFLVKRFGKSYINYRRITPVLIPRFYFWLKILAFFLFRRLFSYRTEGKEYIPDTPPFFLVSSHRNYLDPLFLGMALPFPIRYVTTYEMYRSAKTKWFFRAMDCIPKRRYVKDMNTGREIIKAISQDAVIGIFPEGERAWTGVMNRLKPETLNLFHKFRDVPILPVKLRGNFYAWPRWGKGVRRSNVKVSFQEPISVDPAWDLKEIEDRLVAAIKPGDQDNTEYSCRSGKPIDDITKVIYRCPICQKFDSIRIEGEEGICGNCRAKVEMDERYNLNIKNGRGEVSGNLDEIYNKIRIRKGDLKELSSGQFPEAITRYCEGDEYVIAFSGDASFYQESFPQMEFLFKGSMVLTNKRIYFDSQPESRSVSLEQLGSVTTESNFKLQLYDESEDQLYQAVFDRESVLKWQDLISMIIEKEFNRVPNLR